CCPTRRSSDLKRQLEPRERSQRSVDQRMMQSKLRARLLIFTQDFTDKTNRRCNREHCAEKVDALLDAQPGLLSDFFDLRQTVSSLVLKEYIMVAPEKLESRHRDQKTGSARDF